MRWNGCGKVGMRKLTLTDCTSVLISFEKLGSSSTLREINKNIRTSVHFALQSAGARGYIETRGRLCFRCLRDDRVRILLYGKHLHLPVGLARSLQTCPDQWASSRTDHHQHPVRMQWVAKLSEEGTGLQWASKSKETRRTQTQMVQDGVLYWTMPETRLRRLFESPSKWRMNIRIECLWFTRIRNFSACRLNHIIL